MGAPAWPKLNSAAPASSTIHSTIGGLCSSFMSLSILSHDTLREPCWSLSEPGPRQRCEPSLFPFYPKGPRHDIVVVPICEIAWMLLCLPRFFLLLQPVD